MMFASVHGAPSADSSASDQASSLLPVGVWYSAVAVGTSPGLDVAGGLDGAGGDGAGVHGAVVDGAEVGVTEGAGVAVGGVDDGDDADPEAEADAVADADAEGL